MNPVRVVEIFKLIEKYNKISGHHWTEQGDSTGYEVWGGTTLSPRKRFKTLAAAKKGAEEEDKFFRKFFLCCEVPGKCDSSLFRCKYIGITNKCHLHSEPIYEDETGIRHCCPSCNTPRYDKWCDREYDYE